ncbi:MAG: TlpA family protein disulfide reductase [Chloroflexi bacterium]|nr:TlpA family protein disulfide reductase [Chloroflexota bacterium]
MGGVGEKGSQVLQTPNSPISESKVNYRRVLTLGLVILIVGGFILFLGMGLAKKEPPTGASGAARVNRPAGDFTLPLFSGGSITLSDLKGKPVVINFWASWCPPCREEAPILEEVWRRYRDKGVAFIGVDIQDTEADARAYLEEFGVTYPNGPDIGGRITIDYGVGGIPVTFFVNREGLIVSRWVGAINETTLVSRVEDLLR